MYQAFFNTMKSCDGKVYLNLNPSVKFFQQELLSDTFYSINNPGQINEKFVGRSVMTYYNSRIYTITEVCFNLNPSHKFKLQTGKETSYS